MAKSLPVLREGGSAPTVEPDNSKNGTNEGDGRALAGERKEEGWWVLVGREIEPFLWPRMEKSCLRRLDGFPATNRQ